MTLRKMCWSAQILKALEDKVDAPLGGQDVSSADCGVLGRLEEATVGDDDFDGVEDSLVETVKWTLESVTGRQGCSSEYKAHGISCPIRHLMLYITDELQMAAGAFQLPASRKE